MIIEFADLSKYAGSVTMVDGSFDPIHEGHIAYFEEAALLGLPVVCNVANDVWTASKHAVLLSQKQRGVVLDSIRFLKYIHLSQHSTLEVLRELKPSNYVKGNDWLARGGVPETEKSACSELGIRIVYLETSLNSSSKLLAHFRDAINIKGQDTSDL